MDTNTLQTLIIIFSSIITVFALGVVFFTLRTKQKKSQLEEIDNSKSRVDLELLQKLQATLAKLDDKQTDLRNQFRHFSEKTAEERTTNKELSRNFQNLGDSYGKLLRNWTTLDSKLDDAREKNQRLSEQFTDLTKVFFNTTRRGLSGEMALNYILHAVFGNNAEIINKQYQMKNGKRADVFIHAPQSNIPIDSKFPRINTEDLFNPPNDEAYRFTVNDLKTKLKKHILDVSKYISAADNTTLALLFLPSQPLFEFIYANKDLNQLDEFAQKNKVYLVGPNTLPIVLQIVNKVIRNYKIRKHFKEVFKLLQKFQGDWKRVQDRFETIDKNLTTYQNHFEKFRISFSKTSTNLDRILAAKPPLEEENLTSKPPFTPPSPSVPASDQVPLSSSENSEGDDN